MDVADFENIPVLNGFESIKRYWDKTRNAAVAKILPGEIFVTKQKSEFITTVLGSCIAACIWDPEQRIGGMNHFMLPLKSGVSIYDQDHHIDGLKTRYGNFAMEHLINELLKNGAVRRHLQIKIFGGGAVIGQMTDVGARNIEFVHDYIYQENMKLASEDVGSNMPRKILFDPITGKVWVKKLNSLHNDTLLKREERYLNDISSQESTDGEIELFED